MSKRFHLTLFWLNVLFVILNAAFMYVVPNPTINLICALASLGGCICSWSMYTNDS